MLIQKYFNLKATILLLLVAFTLILPNSALAAVSDCKDPVLTGSQKNSCQVCQTADPGKCLQGNVIIQDLNTIVKVLSGLVGVVVIAMIITGGIQYALASGESAEAVSKAKQRIINSLLALFAFMFIFAFLHWTIPGGAFN